MNIISRGEWGARAPRQSRPVGWSQRTGFTVHHSAAFKEQSIQAIQNFHMDVRNWNSIAYNILVRFDGTIYEGVGWNQVGTHAANANTRNVGVCLIGDWSTTEPPDAAKDALAWLYRTATTLKGAPLTVNTHRQLNPTSCPGDRLHLWALRNLADHTPPSTPARPTVPSTPARPTRPAPGPFYRFPLPAGHYFGPRSGPAQSVSGFYGRTFAGRTDTAWLKIWCEQLRKRGWDVGKGRRWLTRYGIDGRYGDEVAALAYAFQGDQGLYRDRLIGPLTWHAAFTNPVT